ncbi:MAG: hypothetical protein ABEI80_06385 [Haloplanus sp.]
MAVLTALRRTPSALRRNPVVFVPVFAVLLFQLPQLILQSIRPLLASVASLLLSLVFVFVTPFFQAGLFGMADEALDGHTSLDTFLADGKSYYVSMLVVYLLLVAINFALSIVAVLAIVGGVVVYSGGLGGARTAALVGVGVVVAVVALAYLLLVFFTQFYGQAIVVDDLDAIDGLKRSVSVVRANPVSVFGYSVLVGVVGGVVGVAFALLSTIPSPQPSPVATLPAVPASLSLPLAVGLGVVVALVSTLFGGFVAVFSVAFYRTVRG